MKINKQVNISKILEVGFFTVEEVVNTEKEKMKLVPGKDVSPPSMERHL